LDVFVLQNIEVCVTFYWIVGVFIEWIGCNRNRDQQKIVCRKRSVFIVVFPFLWWNKTDKCVDLWLFSSVVVLLLLYSTNLSCWWIMHVTDIVVSWKLGSNCIVFIETGWCCGFRVNSLKFICTVCLVVCKHIRSQSNKFRKC